MEAYPKDFRFSSKGVCNSREEKSDELKVVSCHDGGKKICPKGNNGIISERANSLIRQL